MRILFFGDGEWAVAALRELMVEHDLLGVVLRRQPTGTELGDFLRRHDLPLFAPAGANSASFRKQVELLEPDLCLSVSYDQIIGRRLLRLPRHGFVNLHAAPLPYYQGRATVIWQIINGVSELALTTHWMSPEVDRGERILQETIPLAEDTTLSEALESLVAQVPVVIRRTMRKIETGGAEPAGTAEAGSSFPRRQAGDEFVDWREGSRNIHNKIRALSLPGLYAATCDTEGNVIRLVRSRLLPEYPAAIGIPGSIIGRDSSGVIVKTGDTALHLTEIDVQGNSCIPDWSISSRLLNQGEARLRALEQQVQELNARLARFELLEQGEEF